MESMETVVAFIIKKSETEILSKAEPDTQKMGSWDPGILEPEEHFRGLPA